MTREGCEIVELADGGREFRLVEPVLTWIRVDHQVRLQFGAAELVIECAFSLTNNGAEHDLDPNERGGLGPLLAIYPDVVDDVTMAPDGTLTASFVSGAVITAPPHPQYESWNIAGFWCPPGGFVA